MACSERFHIGISATAALANLEPIGYATRGSRFDRGRQAAQTKPDEGFYDVWLLGRAFPFDDGRLGTAIAATFSRRGTEIPTEMLDALSMGFAEDAHKQRQWRAFVENVAEDPGVLADVIRDLAAFLMPHVAATARMAPDRSSQRDR